MAPQNGLCWSRAGNGRRGCPTHEEESQRVEIVFESCFSQVHPYNRCDRTLHLSFQHWIIPWSIHDHSPTGWPGLSRCRDDSFLSHYQPGGGKLLMRRNLFPLVASELFFRSRQPLPFRRWTALSTQRIVTLVINCRVVGWWLEQKPCRLSQVNVFIFLFVLLVYCMWFTVIYYISFTGV